MKPDISKQFLEARARQDYAALIDAFPYARMLGVSCERHENELLFYLRPDNRNIGNPMMPALHGGVVAGFLEVAAGLHLVFTAEVDSLPSIVNFSIDYLRPALLETTHASCQLVRQGRRVGNVMVTAWQNKRDKPIATARAHFLIA